MGFWNQSATSPNRAGIRGGLAWLAGTTLAICVAIAPSISVAQERLQPGGGTPAAAAGATEPVLVVTFGSINKLMQDVNYISSVVGQPQAGGMFTMLAGTFTQGIDMTMPIGILVPLVDGAPQPIAVIPTTDVKSILKRLEAQTGPADELDDGTLVIAVGANTIYIRQNGPWAAMAPGKDLLDLAPADPTTLFQGLGNNFDIAFRLRMQQVPAETRGMLTAQLRQGFEQAMEQQDEVDEEATRQFADSSIQSLEQFINETDTLQIGLNIDQASKQVAMDSSFTAVPGTSLAAIYGGQQPIPSQFASVIREDAAAYFHTASSISPESIDQARTSFDSVISTLGGALEAEENLNDDQRKDIREMVDRVIELAIKSFEEGRVDLGALLLADSNQFRFVFGSFIADGNEAAQLVKDLAKKIENETDAPRFKFDIATYKDVVMHMVEADVPESEDEARSIFGETLRVHIGTGPKAVYVAVGEDSESLMKELIDNTTLDQGADRPVGQLKLTLLPILQYANSIEANGVISAMINALNTAPDAGVMTVTNESIPNGQSSALRIGEGLIRAIGAAVTESQNARMNNQF